MKTKSTFFFHSAVLTEAYKFPRGGGGQAPERFIPPCESHNSGCLSCYTSRRRPSPPRARYSIYSAYNSEREIEIGSTVLRKYAQRCKKSGRLQRERISSACGNGSERLALMREREREEDTLCYIRPFNGALSQIVADTALLSALQ